MKRLLLVIASAVGLVCLGGTPAWAGAIPLGNWSYSITTIPSSGVVYTATKTGSVSFTTESQSGMTTSSGVVLANLATSSTSSAPDSFTTTGGAWTIDLKLTDNASGTSNTIAISGTLSGSISTGGASVGNTFNPLNTTPGTHTPNSYTWTATNGDSYTVSGLQFTAPGNPSAILPGSIGANITATPGTGGGGGTAGTTPEPSTLVLSCLGLGFAGLASWRKRRRSLAAMLA